MSYDPNFNRQNPNIMGDLMKDITDFMKMRDRSNSTEKRQREGDRIQVPEKPKAKKRHYQQSGLFSGARICVFGDLTDINKY